MDKVCELKIGYLCNNRCVFCLNRHRVNLGNLTTGKLINALLLAKKKGHKTIALTGGEVTIRKDFFTILSFAKKHNLQIIIHTNGRMCYYEHFVKKLTSIGNYQFLVSLHAHTSEIHDKLTTVKNSFYQTSTGIKNLIKYGHIVNTNTVINKLNMKYMEQIADFLISLNVAVIALTFPECQGAALDNFDQVVPKYTDVASFIKKAVMRFSAKKKEFFLVNIPQCIVPEFAANILERTPFSDIDFNGYWENALERDSTKTIKFSFCKSCKYYKTCPGVDKAYINFFGSDEFNSLK